MTSPYKGGGPPIWTIDDVLRRVRQVFAELGMLRSTPLGAGVEWLVGERYAGSEGAPPRVYILRGEDAKVGPSRTIGDMYIGSVTETATVLFWGSESTADEDRYVDARRLGAVFLNALRYVAPGRVTSITMPREVTNGIVTYGEQFRFRFTHTWDIPRIREVWALPTTPTDPPDPMAPNGPTTLEPVLDVTVEGDR